MLTRIKTDGDINRYCGLSTDTKPTDGVPNMSEFSEIDTSKKYVFDEENGQWVEDTGSGGGGGGGSGKQDTITVVGLAKFDGNGGFSDVDYQTPSSSPIKVLINDNGEIKWIDLDRLFNVNYLCFEAAEANSTIQLTPYVDDAESDIPELSLEYSTDKIQWTEFIAGTTVITLSNIGDKVYLRGDNETFCHYLEESEEADNGYQFEMSGKIKASGSLMSIFDKYDISRKISVSGACYMLFYDCGSLITAPELPATTLAKDCYDNMFCGCHSLTTAPELPATTLTEYCYYGMFGGCTSLTIAPELPATTLAEYCYEFMFSGGCTSLATAPELPATTLAEDCYSGMFSGCTSLATAPELPATTLAEECYIGMFSGCTSLATAPELPATTLAELCYNKMFYNCAALQNVKVSFTAFTPSNATSDWITANEADSTFTCPGALDISTRSSSTVPSNWTIVRV